MLRLVSTTRIEVYGPSTALLQLVRWQDRRLISSPSCIRLSVGCHAENGLDLGGCNQGYPVPPSSVYQRVSFGRYFLTDGYTSEDYPEGGPGPYWSLHDVFRVVKAGNGHERMAYGPFTK